MSSVPAEAAVASPVPVEGRPPLRRDASFHGMLATQFLGAFNDNLFKQLVLLLCIDALQAGGADRQPLALATFAVPFVLFSGIAGWLSDRVSKRSIVVLMKVLEIVVTLAGLAAFVWGGEDLTRQIPALMVVLFLMATHSAFFGPSKYGILPEMLRERDLPSANGLIQMTTFLAIVFGWALAGYAKDWFHDRLWVVSLMCVAIALVGTLTALLIRPTPIAQPGLPFRMSAFAIDRDTWRLLKSDRELVHVLIVSSMFWFLGGVVQPSVNLVGSIGMGLSDGRTSVAGACMGVGIAVGCAVAARASRRRINFGLAHLGAWGLVGSLAAIAILGARAASFPLPQSQGAESLGSLLVPTQPLELRLRIILFLLGLFGGWLIVPLQVFLQARPPEELKGRMIGAMNLTNWLGIVASSPFLLIATTILNQLHVGRNEADPTEPARNAHWLFAALAAIMLPVALFYRPPDAALGEKRPEGDGAK